MKDLPDNQLLDIHDLARGILEQYSPDVVDMSILEAALRVAAETIHQDTNRRMLLASLAAMR